MAARLTDKQKKKIIADYVQLGSYNAVAKKHRIADSTVKRIVLSDTEMQKKVEQKKEENSADILAYMESKKDVVCEIIGIGLEVLRNPEKLATANPTQITTALGTLIDKWATMNGTNSREQADSHNALIDAIRNRNNED